MKIEFRKPKNTMGNQQSNNQTFEAAESQAVRNAQSRFKRGDTVFFENRDLVTITQAHRDDGTYDILLPDGEHINVPEAMLSHIAKARPASEIFEPRPRPGAIDVPFEHRERRDPESDSEEGEDDHHRDDQDSEEDEDDEDEEYEEPPPEMHPCGKCPVDWQCACETADVEVNENYEDDLAAALQESAIEAAELEAALRASAEEVPPQNADNRRVEDLEDYNDEDSY
jgi:hypothetical protein